MSRDAPPPPAQSPASSPLRPRAIRRARFWRDHRWAPTRLSAYLDGDLAARSRERLLRHLRECEECRSALASLERMLGRMRGLPSAGASERPAIAAAVRRRLREAAPDDER